MHARKGQAVDLDWYGWHVFGISPAHCYHALNRRMFQHNICELSTSSLIFLGKGGLGGGSRSGDPLPPWTGWSKERLSTILGLYLQHTSYIMYTLLYAYSFGYRRNGMILSKHVCQM